MCDTNDRVLELRIEESREHEISDKPEPVALELSNFAWLSVLVAMTGIAFGTGDPAANNSALELAPDNIAAITGLRSMFRQLGVSVGSAVMVFFASRASDTASGLEVGYVVLGLACIANVFLALGIPDKVGSGRTAQVIGADDRENEPKPI